MPEDNETLFRPYGPADLAPHLNAAGIGESEYMLGIADATPHVGVVTGWGGYGMLREDVQWGFAATMNLGLRFEALGLPRHPDNFLKVFTRHPEMQVVIDHGMKPQIAAHSPDGFASWAGDMERPATETSALCKFSGLITEATPGWTVDRLRPYVEHIVAVFGADRVMWGSDWPVCGLAGEYGDWHDAAVRLKAGCNAAENKAIFGGTANRFYDLGL